MPKASASTPWSRRPWRLVHGSAAMAPVALGRSRRSDRGQRQRPRGDVKVATHDEALALTKQLAKQLHADRPALHRLDRYYRGEHPLAFASEKFEKAFGGLFRMF